ncbi:MAG: glycosyltransferase family 39 protein [Magnetococcales bacterium]|nr:glycosyltransferase family 39 protein [Magnetococcales bacterium]
METAQDPESGQREWWWLSAILLLALVLRLHGLTFQSHWNDELQSAVLGDPEIPLNLVVRRTLLDVHPPLYQVVLRAWYRTFGYTEFVGRALSVLFGVCGVGALYFLGREVAGRRVGLSAALLGALNVFLIAYSQETRSYALLFLLSSLSWLFFIRLLKDPLWKRTPGYLLSTMALLYTHYFGLFVVMAQGIAFLGHLRVVPQQRGRALRVVGTRASSPPCPYYQLPVKEQFREMAREMGKRHQGYLLYALKWTDELYNVSFRQLGIGLRANRAGILAQRLAQEKAPPRFWLLDGHGKLEHEDFIRRFGLKELDRVTLIGVIALLLESPPPERLYRLRE